MKIGTLKNSSCALLFLWSVFPGAVHAQEDLVAEIRALKARLKEVEPLKARLKRLETLVLKQAEEKKRAETGKEEKLANDVKAPEVHRPDAAGSARTIAQQTILASFTPGLSFETANHDYSFKFGGRIMVDGGGITLPLNGYSNQVGFRQARVEVSGRLAKYWFYKLMYDFAGSVTYGSTLGGIRETYIGFQHPALTLPFTKDPLWIMVGSVYEPFSLQSLNSADLYDFIENPMVVDAMSPSMHVGAVLGARGDDWTFKTGIFSTSFQDQSLNPGYGAPAQFGVPRFPGTGVASNAWWQPSGGSQYVDVASRLTYAPIHTDHNLLHLGASSRLQKPNDATGANDNRVMLLGSNVYSEANILGQHLLGTPDLSCGTIVVPGSPQYFNTSTVAAKCSRSVLSYGVELAAATGPFSMQAEYIASRYYRDQGAIERARLAGAFAPGGSSPFFSGYYAQFKYNITGEERAEAYSVKNPNGAVFDQLKIKHPVSEGGFGALSVGARFSSINLNDGPFQGATLYNLLYLTTIATPNPAAASYVANAGVIGGRQQNLTLGFNWYPEMGLHFQFNWTRVMNVSAPLNLNPSQAYSTGSHPNLLEMRSEVYW